jgi:hypothetical protein
MEKYKAFITPIDNAIAALERFYELGNMEGFTNQEMSRISSCLNKVRKAKSDYETPTNAPLVDVSGSLPTEDEKDIEMNRKADRITHAEHKFGFITGFQYCYEWITKTGEYGGNNR